MRNMWHIVLVCLVVQPYRFQGNAHELPSLLLYVTSLLHEMRPQLPKEYCMITLALRNHEIFGSPSNTSKHCMQLALLKAPSLVGIWNSLVNSGWNPMTCL